MIELAIMPASENVGGFFPTSIKCIKILSEWNLKQIQWLLHYNSRSDHLNRSIFFHSSPEIFPNHPLKCESISMTGWPHSDQGKIPCPQNVMFILLPLPTGIVTTIIII